MMIVLPIVGLVCYVGLGIVPRNKLGRDRHRPND